MENKQLKILAYVHGYFPNHNAGAEAMLHEILLNLKEKGHEVKVLTRNPGATEYEGIPIFDVDSRSEDIIIDWSDVIITHLDFSRRISRVAIQRGKKIIHLVHNDKQLEFNQINHKYAHLAIANSEWIRKTIPAAIPSMIVYPPTDPKRYKVKPTGKAISLLNMNEAKGGKIFWQLARLLPEREFIGVKGAYGHQIEFEKELPNVTIYDNSPDVKSIYKKSRIVIMPSSYESWGRVGMEASCSGIPVIAAPTPGLKESLGEAGIFAPHDDVVSYVEAIRMLDDEDTYKKYSKAVMDRSKEIDEAYKKQLESLESALLKLF